MQKALLLLVGGITGAVLTWTALAQDPVLKSLPFSTSREAGDTLYLSGQIPRTSDGEEVRESAAAETKQAMENLGAILTEKGYTWSDVVNVTVYLNDLEDYAEMNKAYAAFFDGPFPARACIGGVEIAFGHRVEISAIAYKAN